MLSRRRKRLPKSGECNFGMGKLLLGVGNAGANCESIPQIRKMKAQIAPHAFFQKSLIPDPELDFLFLKSLIANCAAYFFFEKSNFQTEIRLRKFAEWFRILRRLSHRGTAVAFCAAWFFVGHQSQFALHIPRWNTSRILRRLFFRGTPCAICDSILKK